MVSEAEHTSGISRHLVWTCRRPSFRATAADPILDHPPLSGVGQASVSATRRVGAGPVETAMRTSGALIGAVANAIERRHVGLEEWPVDRLLRLARWVAVPRPLGWCPGWYFGLGDTSADVSVRLRKRLWKHFAAIHAQHSFAMRWYRNLRIWLYLGNDQSWAMFVGGAYEPNEFAFLATVLRPGMTFVDVGANEGLYTAFAARWVRAKGRVLAVEPSSRERARLSRNVDLNRLRNVAIVPVAASSRSGEAVLRIAGYGHEGHNTLGAFIYDTSLAREETVPLARLDDVVRKANVDRVDVMKVDVEGAELGVLEGAHDVLSRDHPILVLELCDAALQHQGARSSDVVDLLKGHGYRLFVFDPTSGRPTPGERPPEQDRNIVAVPPGRGIVDTGGDGG
jgi:FkbM family methyltransferase